MSKTNDIEDLLGEKKPAAKKAAPAAKKAAPAKTTKVAPAVAKKAAATKATAPATKPAVKKAPVEKAPKADKPAPKRERVPVEFAEGEKEALMKRIPKLIKGTVNSKDLAVKLEIATRKLRPVLYSLERAGTITLQSAASRTQGMDIKLA